MVATLKLILLVDWWWLIDGAAGVSDGWLLIVVCVAFERGTTQQIASVSSL
jgi:hypothetical protein